MSNKALKSQFARSNQGGFTLTEVMIGMMILTVAIVAATQILIGLIGFNQNNVNSLKAHYLAMEGIEIVRNIRDTNWLHNQDWLGEGEGPEVLWDGNLVAGPDADNPHVLGVVAQAVAGGAIDSGADFSQWKPFAPWQIVSGETKVEFLNDEVSGVAADEDGAGFTREIQILPYEGEECLAAVGAMPDADSDVISDDCSNFVLVKSRVTFTQGIDERTIELQTILTNWKDGAL